jgi:hypothetical protein
MGEGRREGSGAGKWPRSISAPTLRATATGSSRRRRDRDAHHGRRREGGLLGGYELKLNSYDLGVDIELADAIERLRFEHPEVAVIILKSGKDRVFCAGANIRMLAGATHAHKVNFCKFTNETRNSIEDASENSGQKYVCVVNGTAAGGGYELALACDHIMLVDDGSAAVSLPELPLLAVLPGTGGLTRVTDKRKVRRDHADVFCTTEGRREGQARGRLAPGRRGDAALQARRGGREAREGDRRETERQTEQGHRPHADHTHAYRQRQRVQIRLRRLRSRQSPRHDHAARTGRRTALLGSMRWPAKALRSGRCSWRASWTTRSSIFV